MLSGTEYLLEKLNKIHFIQKRECVVLFTKCYVFQNICSYIICYSENRNHIIITKIILFNNNYVANICSTK